MRSIRNIARTLASVTGCSAHARALQAAHATHWAAYWTHAYGAHRDARRGHLAALRALQAAARGIEMDARIAADAADLARGIDDDQAGRFDDQANAMRDALDRLDIHGRTWLDQAEHSHRLACPWTVPPVHRVGDDQ